VSSARDESTGSGYLPALGSTAVVYAVVHHLGLLPSGLGRGPDGTQWADWLDLAVPWLVLTPAALTLRAAQASSRTWALFGAGVVAYCSGHGIHLAANSIGNQRPGQTAHLWDEVVGHQVWYLGVALVLAALATTMIDRPRPPLAGHVLGLAAGLTWASNAVGGGTEVFSLAVAAAAFGWLHRRGLGLTLLVGYLPAVAVLLVELIL
jgi:hypothetical protein